MPIRCQKKKAPKTARKRSTKRRIDPLPDVVVPIISSKDRLEAAIACWKTNPQLKYRQLGRQFDVPWSTIRDRCNGKMLRCVREFNRA
ncbi:hypothetical protein B0O99DRAFT_615484 [Bisporella sp. PMI_857]|nr:hypothetical protein B0O99DRAFT_615484 [Bisporella sp. PMI_857]